MFNQLREFKINKSTVKSSHSDEAALLSRIVKGDQDAFERLYKLYYNRLFRFVFRTAGDWVNCEEVINDVMLVVWDKAATYNSNCRPSTWIFGIAYNKVRKALAKRRAIPEDPIDEIHEQDGFPFNADILLQMEDRDWLEAAFKALTPNQRVVIELTYYNGLHYQEIAELMDCPENTVKTRMFHARKKLSQELKFLARV